MVSEYLEIVEAAWNEMLRVGVQVDCCCCWNLTCLGCFNNLLCIFSISHCLRLPLSDSVMNVYMEENKELLRSTQLLLAGGWWRGNNCHLWQERAPWRKMTDTDRDGVTERREGASRWNRQTDWARQTRRWRVREGEIIYGREKLNRNGEFGLRQHRMH